VHHGILQVLPGQSVAPAHQGGHGGGEHQRDLVGAVGGILAEQGDPSGQQDHQDQQGQEGLQQRGGADAGGRGRVGGHGVSQDMGKARV